MAKKEPKYFSISQIKSFRGCRQEWFYKYKERLEPRKPQRPLYMGTTLHKLLELRANGEDWQAYLFKEVAEKFEALPTDYKMELGEDFIDCCNKIMSQYDWAYGKKDENIKYLATEVKIDCKIKGYKRFTGIVDAICEIDGEQYIMEHKTFKTKKMSLDQTWINVQTCAYIKVLNSQGWNIKGVIWDMVKTSAPEPPKVLKNGQFGKQSAKQTLLSFQWYAPGAEVPEAIYEEIKDNHKEYLDRYITPVLPDVVEKVWAEFVQSVDDIERNKSCPKSLGRDCDWCSFKELCQTELTGGDVEYIKQLYYTTEEQRDKSCFEKFRQTESCRQCQKVILDCSMVPDFEQCRLYCTEYKKYKEENK